MNVSALSDGRGKPVDWWFVYKLPQGVGPFRKTSGDEFLYCDSQWDSELHLSTNRWNDGHSAVSYTLSQILSKHADVGHVMWNDEIPPTRSHPKPVNNSAKGHSKGVLAFNRRTNSGFYLLHSTPRFPAVGEINLPDDEREYGQTFLCITINYSTVIDIAEILRLHQEPQVYASMNLPSDARSSIVRLANHDHVPDNKTHPLVADFTFRSKGRNDFRLFAKNKKWSEPGHGEGRSKDFWKDLVGPALGDTIDVETWRRGEVFANVDPGTNHVTFDVLSINLAAIGYHGYQWPFTKDHAKWGSTEHRPPGLFLRHPGYVVIADINRDESQAKRGGGGLAFQHDGIWQALKSVERVETTISKAAHRERRIA